MSEIVNLRRARKARSRAEAATQAQANRTKHGVSKAGRDKARAQAEKHDRAVARHRLDNIASNKGAD